MADQVDVERALVGLMERALLAEPCGGLIRIYRGWPVSSVLNADLASGAAHVTVFPDKKDWERLTPFPAQWPLPGGSGLSASVQNDMVTRGGQADGTQLVGALIDGVAYVHRTVPDETAAAIVGCLATMVQIDRPCRVMNSTLRCPGARGLVVRVVADRVLVEEIARQKVGYQLAFWCPTPDMRDALAGFADLTIAACRFLDLPDGSVARLLANGGESVDTFSDANLYRRNIHCAVEFATTRREVMPAMVFGDLRIDGSHVRYG